MKKQTAEILAILEKTYPEAHCELNYTTPLELVIATCLSAQTTDKQVNIVTKTLFAACKSLDDYLALSVEDIEGYIHSLGFYHNKAKNLYMLFRELTERFNGVVPQTMEELTSLSGVGRKTASVVLAEAFKVPALAVDTHVFRVSHRLGLATDAAGTADETQDELKKAIDRDMWIRSHHLMIFHGRRMCHASRPECEKCPLAGYCRIQK